MNKTDRSKKDQVTCNKCGRIVGCDIKGKKHKCECGEYRIDWVSLYKLLNTVLYSIDKIR
jgi:hypothetical protein